MSDHPLIQTFMTHRMTDDAVRALATGREEETAQVLDAVRRSHAAAPGTLQHVLIYGPRGFGKSFLTRLVQIRAGDLDTESAPLRFVLLPEEQKNVTRNPHALLAYIAHKLADLRTGEDGSWTESMFQWPDPAKEAAHWNEAANTLEAELDRSFPGGQGLAVVAIENFDFLLSSLFKEEIAEQRLRGWLDRPGNRVMVLATATGTVDMDYDRPLFQAFQSIRLRPWTPEDCIAYFDRHRRSHGKPPLDDDRRAKARAIADFIGGNPRLAQLLADVLDTQDALSVAQTMTALADKLADYYRRRIDDLPPLAQGLLDALIRGGEPTSQTDLAARVGADGQNAIARIMQDLQRTDIIRGYDEPGGRSVLYQVTDRVFVHFYRLRQGNQSAQDSPLTTILDFLRAFYSRTEQRDQALAYLDQGRPAEARVFADLAAEGGGDGDSPYRTDWAGRLERLESVRPGCLPLPVAEIVARMDACPETAYGLGGADGDPLVRAIIQAQALARMGMAEEADRTLTRALAETANDKTAEALLALERTFLLVDELDRIQEAVTCLRRIGPDVFNDWPPTARTEGLTDLAWSLGALGEHDAAIATGRKAAALAEKTNDIRGQARALLLVAFSLGELGDHQEVLATGREAAALAEKANDIRGQAMALGLVAFSLRQRGDHQEAIAIGREAAALAAQAGAVDEQADALRLVVFSLRDTEQREDAAATALESAELAFSADKAFTAMWSVSIVLESAAETPCPQAIALFGRWMDLCHTQPDANTADWRIALAGLFAAAARARAWESLDALLHDRREAFANAKPLYFFGQEIGRAIAATGRDEGRAMGFASAAGILPRLAAFGADMPYPPAGFNSWISNVVAGLAGACRDPGLLRDVAGLLTTDLAPEAPAQAILLRALADVDAAEKPERILARLDPDVATWIRRVRGLPDPTPRAAKKRSRKR
ncbi:ATP-binding protein [Pararhodospirillum oryzae]|uniref:Orc1-like AAA ATPase domain-containing protein n=1 Tax=Pararhodospirillum oryzae TaxID=478448 RepID=A0A512H5U7_9PROT|nr:ATP-binding protein [Pararhodospirillum oryzae]GEO80827.1 hypothetical protein ROR02_09580 [Pararhodospirillum oryzae]